MFMFLGLLFGLGIIVAPIIVWFMTKGQKRRVLKVIGSSLACLIILGICAVNDHSTPTATAATTLVVQTRDTTKDWDKFKSEFLGNVTIIKNEGNGGILEIAVKDSSQYSLSVTTKDVIRYLQMNNIRDLDGNSKLCVRVYRQVQHSDNYGNFSYTDKYLGECVISKVNIQKIANLQEANLQAISDLWDEK